MKRVARYTRTGIGSFILLVITAFLMVYASQTGNNPLFYSGVIAALILSFILLYLIIRCDRSYGDALQEIDVIKQREKARMKEEDKSSQKNTEEQTETIDIDGLLSRVMPPETTVFETAGLYTEKVLQNIAKEIDIVQGLAFVLDDNDQQFHISGEYAYFSEEQPRSFSLGETISGQVAKNKKLLNLENIPDGYITILSGLGKGSPHHLIIAPIVNGDESIGVLELAAFKPVSKEYEKLIEKIAGSMADKLNSLRK